MKSYLRSLCGKGLLIGYTLLTLGCSSPERDQNTLHISFAIDPSTADPTKNGDPISSTVHFMLFEGLTRITPESTREPAIAHTIDISPDGRSYTFHLRNAVWSDGTPVRANDFVLAWQRQLTPGYPAPNAHLFYPIRGAKAAKLGEAPLSAIGVRAIDDATLFVELKEPTPYFLELTSFCPFFPIPSHIATADPDWAVDPGPSFVSNGPYRIEKWEPRNSLIFGKNSHYWEANRVTLDRIECAIIEDSTTALNLYRKGELDVLGAPFTSIPLDAIEELSDTLLTYPVAATTICPLNLNHPILQNKNMRKALAYSVDRESIVSNIMRHNEEVATGPVPPIMKGGMNWDFYRDGDVEMARDHFARGCQELGIAPKDLPSLTLAYHSTEHYGLIAQALQEQWQKSLGLKISLQKLDFKVLHDNLMKRNYDIGILYWIAQYNDQMNILDRFSTPTNPKNYSGWDNTDYAHLLASSLLEKTEKRRHALLAQAESLFVEEMPLIPIFHWQNAYVIREGVRGMYVSPIGSIHLEHVSFD